LPKGFFEKNVTRLDTFARVIRHSGEFGASGHCLGKTQTNLLLEFKFKEKTLSFGIERTVEIKISHCKLKEEKKIDEKSENSNRKT
jgi:hypothetical protein